MQENRKLDNELADFTDKLLAGETTQASSDIEDLARVVTHLHDLIEPAAKPSAEFRARLAQRLDQEWDQLQADRARSNAERVRSNAEGVRPAPKTVPHRSRTGSWSTIGGWRRNRLTRLASMAAAIAIVAIGALLLIGPESPPAQGSANGALSVPVIVGIAVVAGVGLVLFWLSQRGKS